MNALIVEDDRQTAGFVSGGLNAIGLSCDTAEDGESGLAKLRSGSYAVAVVDVILPGMSGLELVRAVRKDGNPVPILILSALGSTADKIGGLEAGADDYLSKPFALNELIARVNAVLRRDSPIRRLSQLTVRDLVIDRTRRSVFRSGRQIALTLREYEILECLAVHVGETVSAGTLFHDVWNYNQAPPTSVIETRICLLRKKLCAHGEENLIQTVRGFGYRLI